MKLNQKKLFVLPALTGLMALTSSLSAQNIIDTTYGVGAGSFELGNYSANTPSNLGGFDPFMRLGGGSTTITGWTVAPGGTDWLSGAGWPTHIGSRSIDLPGAGGTGGLSTSIPTLVGSVYTVSFKSSEIISPTPVVTISVDGIGTIGTSIPPNNPPPFPYGQSPFFTFTAVTPVSVVNFSSTALSSHFGAMIDDVVITGAAIPEPSSALLLSVGVAFGLRRRRNSRA